MREGWRTNKGLIVSASAHAALLGLTLVAFSNTPPFEDAQESVPVEIVTDAQLNQIIKGEKTAKVVKTDAEGRQDRRGSRYETAAGRRPTHARTCRCPRRR